MQAQRGSLGGGSRSLAPRGCSCSGMERAVDRQAESGVSEMEVTVAPVVWKDLSGVVKSVHSRSFPGTEPSSAGKTKLQGASPKATRDQSEVLRAEETEFLAPGCHSACPFACLSSPAGCRLHGPGTLTSFTVFF